MNRTMTSILLALLCLCLGACTTLRSKGETPLSAKEVWGLSPLANNTETPYASERATSITSALLRARGIQSLEIRQDESKAEEGILRQKQPSPSEALDWARQRNIRFLVTGTVTEWRYKVGLDGEPAAGVTMQIIDVPSAKVVWSAASGKSGWSREALSSVGQQLIYGLLETVPLLP